MKNCKKQKVLDGTNIYCDCEVCDNCKYNEWYSTIWKGNGHLRFYFNTYTEAHITNNKQIIKLFEADFINNKISICFWKGGCIAYVISKLSYNKYDYWKQIRDICFPCKKIIDFGGQNTIQIIIELIKYCENISFIKQEKIKKIKNDIINVDSRKQQWKKKLTLMTMPTHLGQ